MTQLNPMPVPAPESPSHIPAIDRCRAARKRSLEESQGKNIEPWQKRERANQEYCDAMPDLAGRENIRDFIACTTYGMIAGTIGEARGPKLLYAAQVALAALSQEPPKTKKRLPPPPKEVSNHIR
jgi:hypothetical protein